MLKINEIREMIKMVEESSIQRFEHETTRIVIVKNDLFAGKSPLMELDAAHEIVTEKQAASRTIEDAVESAPAIQQGAQQGTELHKIISPTVGTFYSAPQPGAEPFVKVGQKVTASTVVCVLEAMKLFNEIDAGVDGEIVEILFKDGDFVEYGQPLFVVRKGD